jgi:hypothetical protein
MRDLFLDLDTYDSFACLSQFIDKESGEIVEDKVQSFLKEIEGKTGYHQIRGYQSKEDLQMALALRGCPLLLPKVNMGAYRMYVTFWTPWTGLSRETIKITRRDNTYGFLSRNCESIAQYWWGITI